MIGKRERQKQDRQHRILRAAALLFARGGYPETSMEDIAARADLATGTVYNYFDSKAELLAAVVAQQTQEVVAMAETIVAQPGLDVDATFAELTDLYLNLIARHERSVWREVIGAAYAEGGKTAALVFESDVRLLAQTERLLEAYRRRGKLCGEISPGHGAFALYSIYLSATLAFITSEGVSLDATRSLIRKGVDVVLHGLLNRSQSERRQS
jgi:AcrR family transcriptional regulator